MDFSPIVNVLFTIIAFVIVYNVVVAKKRVAVAQNVGLWLDELCDYWYLKFYKNIFLTLSEKKTIKSSSSYRFNDPPPRRRRKNILGTVSYHKTLHCDDVKN